MTPLSAFGKVISELRKQHGLSNRQMAKLVQLKPSHYKRIERGKQRSISWKVTLRISKVFGFKVYQVAKMMEKKMNFKKRKSYR